MALILQRTPKTAQYFTQVITPDVGIDMMYIPGRAFLMGSPEDEEERRASEGPQHLVQVPDFLMGRYPVTQAQWRVVANLPQQKRKLDAEPSHFKGDDLPVESVSWFDAVEFCDRLSTATSQAYRLPSEAEWEYACRAGTTTPFHFGETIDAEVANYQAEEEKIGETIYPGKYGLGKFGEYRKKTTPVGFFQVANNFGLYDMHGNVWEWCADHWHENYENSPPIDGSAWLDKNAIEDTERLLRGGSWHDSPRNCRSAFRYSFEPAFRYYSLGFRVSFSARTLRSP